MCPQNQASYLLCLVCTKFAASFLALPVRFDSFGECAARTSLCPARPGLEATTRLISPLQLSGRLLHYSGRLTFGLSDLRRPALKWPVRKKQGDDHENRSD